MLSTRQAPLYQGSSKLLQGIELPFKEMLKKKKEKKKRGSEKVAVIGSLKACRPGRDHPASGGRCLIKVNGWSHEQGCVG